MTRRIDRLANILRTANVRDHLYVKAECELVQAGEASMPFLEDLLNSSDQVVRARARDVLKKLRSLGKWTGFESQSERRSQAARS